MRLKTMAVALVGVLMMLIASAQRVEATPIGTTNPNAISGPNVITINFEDLTGEVAEIGDFYADLGLSMSGLFGKTNELPASFGLIAATNGDDHCCPDVTFNFLEIGHAFGFYIYTKGPAEATFEISTFYGGVQTASSSLTFATGGEPKFVGIVEPDNTTYFDQVVVSALSQTNDPPIGFAIDNIKMQVPEPASLLLLALGALTLLFGGALTGRLKQA